MSMSKRRNPTNNAILQACLDIVDSGYGTMSVNDFVTKISADPKLLKDMQAIWNRHAYPDKSIKWVSITKTDLLMTLSPNAMQVLVFLGMYCHQSTLIQVTYSVLSAITGIKPTKLREAVKELVDSGCIKVAKSSARHDAPIYAVNPVLIKAGARTKKDSGFTQGLHVADYILKRTPELIVQETTIKADADTDGKRVVYTKVTLERREVIDAKQASKDAELPF